eukprot:6195820-Pleurochrysis_carterae.AAC.1
MAACAPHPHRASFVIQARALSRAQLCLFSNEASAAIKSLPTAWQPSPHRSSRCVESCSRAEI